MIACIALGSLGTCANGTERDAALRPIVTLFSRIAIFILLTTNGDTADKWVALQAGRTTAESPVEFSFAHSLVAAGSSLTGINALL